MSEMVADTELKALEQLGFDSPLPTRLTLSERNYGKTNLCK